MYRTDEPTRLIDSLDSTTVVGGTVSCTALCRSSRVGRIPVSYRVLVVPCTVALKSPQAVCVYTAQTENYTAVRAYNLVEKIPLVGREMILGAQHALTELWPVRTCIEDEASPLHTYVGGSV